MHAPLTMGVTGPGTSRRSTRTMRKLVDALCKAGNVHIPGQECEAGSTECIVDMKATQPSHNVCRQGSQSLNEAWILATHLQRQAVRTAEGASQVHGRDNHRMGMCRCQGPHAWRCHSALSGRRGWPLSCGSGLAGRGTR
jgi:hypothetical protein